MPLPNTNPPLSGFGEMLEVIVLITESRHLVCVCVCVFCVFFFFFISPKKRFGGFIHTTLRQRLV